MVGIDSSTIGQPGGLASLGASGTVTQNPAIASTTPTPGGIPIADATGSIGQWGQNRVVATANVLADNQASPPGISGTVSITNGSATVTGTSTSFTTTLAVGMVISFASQPGVFYQVSTITSTTAMTTTATYSGTTNASTTLLAPRVGDSYIVGASPTGAWAIYSQGDLVVNLGANSLITLAGTCSVTNGNATVTGTNTVFTNLCVGDKIGFYSSNTFNPAGGSAFPSSNLIGSGFVSSITSNTSLTLTATFSGTTTATTYAQVTTGWYRLQAGVNNAPYPGLTCLVASCQGTPAGSFASQTNNIAYYNGTIPAWQFITPTAGQTITFGTNDVLEGAVGIYRGAFAGIQQAAWQISGGYYNYVQTSGTTSTTSTTATGISAMTMAPPMAGTYEVSFFIGGTWNSGAPSATEFGTFLIVFNSTSGGATAASYPVDDYGAAHITARGSVNGVQGIYVAWDVNAASTQTASGYWAIYAKRIW